MNRISGGDPRYHRDADDRGGEDRSHAHRHCQSVDAVNAVADALGQQDVAPPADGRPERIQHADRVDGARPGVGQEHHPDRGEPRPQQTPSPPAAEDGDAEGPKELHRTGRPQRDPGDGGHEQQRHSGRHDTEGDARREGAPRERARPRSDEQKQQHTRPRQPQPGRSLDADAVDQRQREGKAHLNAHHRTGRHQGTRAGAVRSHHCIEGHAPGRRPRVIDGVQGYHAPNDPRSPHGTRVQGQRPRTSRRPATE